MPSIASMYLDHLNRVKGSSTTDADTIPFSGNKKGKAKIAPPVMSEGMLKNKEMLRNTLRVGIWTVEFTKVDGTPSVMECTLDSRYLPVVDPSTIAAKPRTETPEAAHLLHVYSTDRQGWRSFATPNVTKIYKKVENL